MEEQASRINGLESLNSELDGFLSERHAREEALCARVKALEAEALSFEREKVKFTENERRMREELSGFKNKDGEIDRLRREAGELKAGLALERGNANDSEARLREISKQKEGFERSLEQAAQENSRSEEGYLLKIELIKKELSEHSRHTKELELKLAAAESRLDHDLEEAGRKEKMLAGPCRAMLREAEDKLLVKEKMLAEMNSRPKKIGRDLDGLGAGGRPAAAPRYIADFDELAAGVAHQVGKTVSIIRSHAEFCAEAPGTESAKESLNVIVRNIGDLQKKIAAIINFSKPVIPRRSAAQLSAVLSEVLAGLRSSGRLENVKVSLKGGENLGPVSLDPVLFASAAEQLLLNAVEAMPGGGGLSVSLSGGGGRQRLEVEDTGPGVDNKKLGAVFRPFFTTRPGKTGLGLAFARGVALAHGGTLELVSEPGKGARAILELPEI